MKERRLITSALPYVNNVPHLGNIVGSHYPADIFARYCRLQGYDVVFIGGTDDHGTPIEIAARKAGKSPKELSDFYYKLHKQIYNWFNISYDNFSRTSRQIHHKLSQEFFQIVLKNGYITEKTLNLPHCKDCNKQLSDRFIQGLCPFCKSEDARGDQCEKCGSLLDPDQLIKPYCVICKSKQIEFKKKKHLFLDLKKLSPRIKKWLISNEQLRGQVKKLALGWFKIGLKERCITRDLKWGIKTGIKKYEDLVFYVWAEAPIGYISSTKELLPNKWKKYWQDPNTKIYNFLGKDNIPFHTIFFPGELLAHGNYNLPYNVVGLQYLNYEKTKFSKSKGIGVFCDNLEKAGLDPDYWRFYLAYVIPETKDTEFLWKEFKERINKELIGNLSNYINRVLMFIEKNNGSEIPAPTKIEKGVVKSIQKQIDEVIKNFEKVELRKALQSILKISDIGNKFIDDKQIWKTKDKNDLFICANIAKILGLLIQPFLPNTSQKILKMLRCNETDWSNIKEFNLENHKIGKIQHLFKKIEDGDIEKLKEKTSKVTDYFGKIPELDKYSLSSEVKAKRINIAMALIQGVQISNKNKELEKLKKNIISKIIKEEDKITKGYKEFYSEKDLIPAAENLRKLVKKNGKLPNINTLVDIYNLISFESGLSVGAHDVSKIEGNVGFKIMKGDEMFIPMGKREPTKVKSGEYAFMDDKEVLCRMDVKQCNKTKITKNTKDLIIYVQGNKKVSQKYLTMYLDKICHLVEKICGGRCTKMEEVE